MRRRVRQEHVETGQIDAGPRAAHDGPVRHGKPRRWRRTNRRPGNGSSGGPRKGMPSIAREHIGRGPGGHDLADEQIVGLLVVRLGSTLHSSQPRQPATSGAPILLAGKVDRPLAWNLSSSRPESVPTFSVARAARATECTARIRRKRRSACAYGCSCPPPPACGRVEVQRHGPGRRHDVAPAAVGAGDQHRGAVVQQQVGTDSSTGWISGAGDTLDSLGTPAARRACA